MSGLRSKRKGSRVEREIVNILVENGICAERIPLSGAVKGFKGDIRLDGGLVAEVKSRKSGAGFALLEKWLGENDFLFLKADREKPLAVMSINKFICVFSEYLKFVKKNDYNKS